MNRTSLSASRSFELATSNLSFSLGVVDQEGDSSLRPSASVTYRRAHPRGEMSASLTHRPSIDDGDAYGNTRIDLDFSQGINSISSWSAGVSYVAVNEFGGSDDDDRATARVTYSRSLTEDWRMNTGVEHIRESESGGSSDTSNIIFFNIERDITFGF